jgi:hypothetical protein
MRKILFYFLSVWGQRNLKIVVWVKKKIFYWADFRSAKAEQKSPCTGMTTSTNQQRKDPLHLYSLSPQFTSLSTVSRGHSSLWSLWTSQMGTSVKRREGTLSLLNEKSVIYNLGEKNVGKDFTTFRVCNVVVYCSSCLLLSVKGKCHRRPC